MIHFGKGREKVKKKCRKRGHLTERTLRSPVGKRKKKKKETPWKKREGRHAQTLPQNKERGWISPITPPVRFSGKERS